MRQRKREENVQGISFSEKDIEKGEEKENRMS